MADTYTIEFQLPFWPWPIPIKNVVYHWFDDLQPQVVKEADGYIPGQAKALGVKTANGKLRFIPTTWGFNICEDHAELQYKKAAAKCGQEVPRA